MDINSVTLSGRVYDMGFNPTINPSAIGVAEGKLRVVTSRDGDKNKVVSEFSIRAYGKKSVWISGVEDGTMVAVQGVICEEKRVNASDPTTTRSKVYIDIACMKVLGEREDD